MIGGCRLRSVCLHALLIASIIQGMTADTRKLASPFLLQRLVLDPAADPCDAHDDRLRTDEGSVPSRDGDDEGAPDEFCVATVPGAVAAWRRHGPGPSRSRSLWSGPAERFVQAPSLLLERSPDVTPRANDLTLSLCRLTC